MKGGWIMRQAFRTAVLGLRFRPARVIGLVMHPTATAQGKTPITQPGGGELPSIRSPDNRPVDSEAALKEVYERESPGLEKRADSVVAYLSGLTLLSLAVAVALVSWSDSGQSRGDLRVVLLCVFAGTLGSSISALVSALERIGAGWEFSNGWKWPPDPKGRPPEGDDRPMFGERLRRGFLARPALGAATGYLVYVGLRSGGLAIKDATTSDTKALIPVFVALLGGLAAKSFLDKLRKIFGAMF
jgi:hypothetical protein